MMVSSISTAAAYQGQSVTVSGVGLVVVTWTRNRSVDPVVEMAADTSAIVLVPATASSGGRRAHRAAGVVATLTQLISDSGAHTLEGRGSSFGVLQFSNAGGASGPICSVDATLLVSNRVN